MKTELTPDQINVAIAELCGWKHVGPNPWTDSGRAVGRMPYQLEETVSEIPPFATSLDAMAQAEATLTEEELDNYASKLVFLMKTGEKRVFCSPPERRARAFLAVKQRA